MNKKSKKLVLNRETLDQLEPSLWQVAGGATAVTDCGTRSCMPPHSGCEFSGRQTCFTCQPTSQTNLC